MPLDPFNMSGKVDWVPDFCFCLPNKYHHHLCHQPTRAGV